MQVRPSTCTIYISSQFSSSVSSKEKGKGAQCKVARTAKHYHGVQAPAVTESYCLEHYQDFFSYAVMFYFYVLYIWSETAASYHSSWIDFGFCFLNVWLVATLLFWSSRLWWYHSLEGSPIPRLRTDFSALQSFACDLSQLLNLTKAFKRNVQIDPAHHLGRSGHNSSVLIIRVIQADTAMVLSSIMVLKPNAVCNLHYCTVEQWRLQLRTASNHEKGNSRAWISTWFCCPCLKC